MVYHGTGLIEPPNWWLYEPMAEFPPLKAGDLPSRFDWREETGLTDIKNQGMCGSCWAFATTGVIEQILKIKTGINFDISEQHLLDCNESGGSCNGGWFVSKYYKDTSDKCNQIGTVSGIDYPYEAYQKTCECPLTRDYVLEDYAYITPSMDVDAIKQAIYNYGPVGSAVYVTDSFHQYTGGIFKGDYSGTDVNHGIMLVGWDDNQGTNGVWFLRNQWGTGWGENGYMKIEYGANRVGYGAFFNIARTCTYPTKNECISNDCYWYNNRCNRYDVPGCSSLNNPDDCASYGCYWYNNKCNSEPAPGFPIEWAAAGLALAGAVVGSYVIMRM